MSVGRQDQTVKSSREIANCTVHSGRNDYREGDKTTEISWNLEWTKNRLLKIPGFFTYAIVDPQGEMGFGIFFKVRAF